MIDAIIVSDIHLGSRICQAKPLLQFLQHIETKEIVLNGDVFDSLDFRRLKKNHWKVLSQLRKLSKKMKVTWIAGNHCGPANSISHLLGITVQDEYILYSGQKKILVIHGDQFDDFINKHPIITSIADSIYYALQSFTTHSMASYIKRASKTFLRCTKKVKKRSVEYAKKKYCDAICVAHTHFSESDIESCPQYFNSGSWTEIPSTYLMIINGNIELKNIFPNTYEKEKIN